LAIFSKNQRAFLKKIELYDFMALRCPLVQSKKIGLGKLFSIVVHSTSVPQLQLLYASPALTEW